MDKKVLVTYFSCSGVTANAAKAIAEKVANMDEYDVVFVGFPIWWYVAPTIINTFLESYDWTGKKIVLFATSGGSGFGKTVENLEKSCLGADIKEGGVLRGMIEKETILGWVKGL